MSRITEKMLDYSIERLNDVSKCKYQIGSSYGYYNLEKRSMMCTGISNIATGSKREIYEIIHSYLKIRYEENNSKEDYVKNCTHLDIFNLHSIKESDFVDNGHIYRYQDKGNFVYCCMTCGKSDFTEKEYHENHKKRTLKELQTLRKNQES